MNGKKYAIVIGIIAIALLGGTAALAQTGTPPEPPAFSGGAPSLQPTPPEPPESQPQPQTETTPQPEETESAITVAETRGDIDTDGDGISDALEARYGTDPNNADSDGDGFLDSEEVLEYGTDPTEQNISLPHNIVHISNLDDGGVIADSTILVKGFGITERDALRIIAEDPESGQTIVLGTTALDAARKFLLVSDIPLLDGVYYIYAIEFNGPRARTERARSEKILVTINTALAITAPTPQQLANKDITQNVLLQNLRLDIKDPVPLLRGQTNPGNVVFVTWKSLLLSSTLLADATEGDFVSIPPRPLENGEHEVYIYAIRPSDFVRSQDVRVSFKVQAVKTSMTADLPPLFWIIVGGIIVIGGTAAILLFRKKKNPRITE